MKTPAIRIKPAQMSMILYKLVYLVNLSTKGGGVKNPQNSVNVVYGCPPKNGRTIDTSGLPHEWNGIIAVPHNTTPIKRRILF